jgi:translation elongation factor EF-4
MAQMVFLLNGKPVDALALVVHRSAEQDVGKAWVKKLRACPLSRSRSPPAADRPEQTR